MNKPIRVLDLRDSPWVDGPGRTVLDTASAIDSSRCQLVVVAYTGKGSGENDYILEARRRELCVETVVEAGAFDPRIIGQLIELIDGYSVDILHTHDFRSNVLGLYCAKRSRIPIIATCHGWIANDLKGRVYTAIDKRILRMFDKLVVVSNIMKDQLVSDGISAMNIDVVPNALIVEDFQPDNENRAFRQELGIGKSTKVISNIGRLSSEKGQRLFLSAAKEVVKICDDVCFVLVGIGADEESLRDLVDAQGLAEYVYFVGYREDMTAVYDSTDLVVQSSSTEGMPNVMLEALLMETPVVATDVGGTGDVVEDGVTGKLIKPNSVEQLAKGMQEFLLEPDRFRAMAVRGRSRVITHFNHIARVEKLSNIYEELHSEATH